MTTPEVGFISASVALRPPRVAIMVADDEHWREWAMTALATASDYWGGGGFILVPFDILTGKPSPTFADIVKAYDPDHIVSMQFSWQEWEALYPRTIQIGGVTEAERSRLIATAHQFTTSQASDDARTEVASWCSPMRSSRARGESGERQMETLWQLRHREEADDRFRRGLPPSPIASAPALLAASEDWRSDVGLMAAMRVGIAYSERDPRPEPTVDDLDWLVRPEGPAPTALIWNQDPIPTLATTGLEAWFVGGQRLLKVSNSYLQDRVGVVVGNTGTDFALAVAYDRLIGVGIWLPETFADDEELLKKQIRPITSTMVSELESQGNHMTLTSTSVGKRRLNKLAKDLAQQGWEFSINGHKQRQERQVVHVRRPTLDSGGYMEFVVEEHVGASIPIPVEKLPDGSIEAMSGLETPVPSNLIFGDRSGWVPYWYVDVSLEQDATPRGRDLPSDALIMSTGPLPIVNLRAGAETVTFDPKSMGFVIGGSFLPGRIGRPRLRGLSMTRWVEAMAEPEGLGVRLSSAGRQAELVRRRLGSRGDLLDLVTPANLAMLQAFKPMKRRPLPEERDRKTVVLNVDPYLSFDAIDDLLPGDPAATTALIDRLSATRILRRGLILDCLECGRPSFVDVDHLGREYECAQCAAMNLLASDRWKKDANEPVWFYDLYTAFRQLLAANGDVVLLAAAKLRGSARTYLDAPELEFFDLESGERVAEIDVIASVNRDVVLVEAKSNGTFTTEKRGPQTQKMLRVARALRADRIVLATTKDHWNAEDVDHLTKQGARVKPFKVTVDSLTSLG